MEPLPYMRSVDDRNVDMRRMTVIGNNVLANSGSTREIIYPKTLRNLGTRPQKCLPLMS